MATITDAQLKFVRAKTGGTIYPYVVDDATVQIYFDAADGDMPTTIVSVLEDMWANAQADVGRVTDFGISVDRANIDHLEDVLNHWRKRAGITDAPALSVGTLTLGIDASEDDEEDA